MLKRINETTYLNIFPSRQNFVACAIAGRINLNRVARAGRFSLVFGVVFSCISLLQLLALFLNLFLHDLEVPFSIYKVLFVRLEVC